MRAELLRRLAAGESLAEVAVELGTSHQRVWAAAALDAGWLAELDQALMRGRPEGVEHGQAGTYKRHQCRCPECRQAKRVQREGQSAPRKRPQRRVTVPLFQAPAV